MPSVPAVGLAPELAPENTPMATVVNIHQAKTHFSRIVDEAAAGREVIIAKAGRPVARLVPIEPQQRAKKLGGLSGRFSVPHDFDAPLDAEVVAAFRGLP